MTLDYNKLLYTKVTHFCTYKSNNILCSTLMYNTILNNISMHPDLLAHSHNMSSVKYIS